MQKILLALSLCVCARGAFGAADDRITLKTDRSTVVFDRARHGAVISFVDNATGVEFVNGSVAQDLFAITWSRPGDTSGQLQRLTGHEAEQVELHVSDNNLTAVFKRLGGQDMTVTCTASTGAGRDDIRWHLRATGSAAVVLEEVRFPILDLRVPLLDTDRVGRRRCGTHQGRCLPRASEMGPGPRSVVALSLVPWPRSSAATTRHGLVCCRTRVMHADSRSGSSACARRTG